MFKCYVHCVRNGEQNVGWCRWRTPPKRWETMVAGHVQGLVNNLRTSDTLIVN